MYSMERDVSRPRTVLLTGVMLAILAVSTVVAWTLTTVSKVDPARRGREIIAQLTPEALENYRPAADELRYYIGLSKGGDPVMWRVVIRKATPDSRLTGSTTAGHDQGVTRTSTWQLRNDLSRGRYTSTNDLITTQIRLEDDRVTVIRSSRNRRVPASAKRPDNYLPEGMLPLVLQLVAQGGEEAIFKLILDNAAIKNNRLNFGTARLTPLGPRAVRVEYSANGSSDLKMIYRFDPDMNVERIEHLKSGIVYKRCSGQTLLKEFPQLKGPIPSTSTRPFRRDTARSRRRSEAGPGSP